MYSSLADQHRQQARNRLLFFTRVESVPRLSNHRIMLCAMITMNHRAPTWRLTSAWWRARP